MMSKRSLLISLFTGLVLGHAAAIASLSHAATKHNQETICQPWEVEDSYRSWLFGRITYCREQGRIHW